MGVSVCSKLHHGWPTLGPPSCNLVGGAQLGAWFDPLAEGRWRCKNNCQLHKLQHLRTGDSLGFQDNWCLGFCNWPIRPLTHLSFYERGKICFLFQSAETLHYFPTDEDSTSGWSGKNHRKWNRECRP